jgi:hypothetical protein
VIEVRLVGAVVRIGVSTDYKLLAEVLRARGKYAVRHVMTAA